MSQRKRILITGVSGLLGSNLGFCWKDRYDLLGTYNTHPVRLKGMAVQQLDLLSVHSAQRVIRDFKPDVVIHCAALADIDACQENQSLARQMNVEMVIRLADIIQTGPKLVYISTDAVYDGARNGHKEGEGIDPANYYGHTKYLGELEALKLSNALIVRTAFFGCNIQDKMSFAQQVVSKLSSRQKMKGFTDVITSMIYTFDFADLLLGAIERDLKGVYNFGCSNSLSKHDFAVELGRQLNLDVSLIEATSIDQFELKTKRAKNLSLNVSKLSDSLNTQIPSIEASMKRFVVDLKNKIPSF